jgi:MFS family permease
MRQVTTSSAAVATDRAVRRMTIALAVMSAATFGTLSFTFSVMLGPMGAELGWSNVLLSAGFTLGAVVGGSLSAVVGRMIDVRGGRGVIVTGSFVGASGVLLWSMATTPAAYLLAWVVIGVGMALGFYDPAFACVVRHAPGRRREAVLAITLAGALASTIYIPLAEFLISRSGWRAALVQLAVLFVVVTLPTNLWGLPRRGVVLEPDPLAIVEVDPLVAGVSSAALTESSHATPDTAPSMRNSSDLRRVALAAVLGYAVTIALGTHLVAFLIVGGRSSAVAAALAAGLGVGKLLGRLGVGLVMRWVGSYRLFMGCHVALGAALAIPLLLPPGPLDLVMVAALGVSAGALTVVRPLYIADLFGSRGFGQTSGRVNRVNRVTTAFVPMMVGAIVTFTGSYAAAWGLLAVGVVAGALILPPLPTPPSDLRGTPVTTEESETAADPGAP